MTRRDRWVLAGLALLLVLALLALLALGWNSPMTVVETTY